VPSHAGSLLACSDEAARPRLGASNSCSSRGTNACTPSAAIFYQPAFTGISLTWVVSHRSLLEHCHSERRLVFVGCGSFFFVYRSSETRSQTAFFQSPLTAKLTAKPVDNSGFPWMGAEIPLASGGGGRRWL
jgi:hypothetical protein